MRKGRSKFVDDIDEIVRVKDVVPSFEPDVRQPDASGLIMAEFIEKKKKTGLYLSDSSYLNLYLFALALNGRYAWVDTEDEMKRAFETELSLEFKLSNIAQAKDFDRQLESIGCFYTDRAVDYQPVLSFRDLMKEEGHEDDLVKISVSEHDRWCRERSAMGWTYGTAHVGARTLPDGTKKNDNVMRDRLRQHHDFIAYHDMSAEDREKDTAAMERMLELIRQYDGLTIYRMR